MSEAAIPVSVVRVWLERIREKHRSMRVPARHCGFATQHDVDLYMEIETACLDAERNALRGLT